MLSPVRKAVSGSTSTGWPDGLRSRMRYLSPALGTRGADAPAPGQRVRVEQVRGAGNARAANAQIVVAQQRLVLVRPLPPPGGLEDARAHPPEQGADLQRLLQVRQQGLGVRAVAPHPVRRRGSRRRRVGHQRLVQQLLLVEIAEAAAADAARRAHPPHAPRQRIVAAGVENHHPQPGPLGRPQHPVEVDGLVLHVGVALQLRVHRH